MQHRKGLISLLLVGIVLIALYIIQLENYLLFHSLAELFSIVIASGVFLVAWNSRKRIANNFLIVIGVAYAFVAFLDLVHTLSYAGMGVFPDYGADLPTQLWLGARYLEAVSLVAGTSFLASSTLDSRLSFGHRTRDTASLLLVYIGITAVVTGTIFLGSFPTAYTEGAGLTQFKIFSEYVIIGLIGIALGLLYRHRGVFEAHVFRYLAAALVLTIGAEFMFTLYVSVYGVSNMIGHLLKIASFYLIYVSVVKTGITTPHEILFRQLNQERDKLADQKQELERQNARLEEFASIVSHDLRNPLNVASGRVDLARDECDSDHLDEVAQAHDRIGELIDDLLLLAREGHPVSDTEPVELHSLTEECWKNVDTAEATIDIDVDTTIRADRSRLQQLVENLIRNAVDHGGDDVTVRVGPLAAGFVVEDDGPGIPSDERDEVFDSGYSTAEDGTGFGLAIVKEIVEAHDWEISVTDGAEGGARFEVSGVEFVEG